MRWLEKIEKRLEWLAFPGLFKYLTFLGVIVFACQWARPDIGEILDFSRSAIMRGEVWRVVTFIFTPSGLLPFGPVSMLFLFFGVMIAMMISDSLEEVWGPTRLTLYILTSWLALAVSQFVFGIDGAMAGGFLYTSMFFAFATLFPKVEFRMFFFLPVQVRFLAWFAFAGLVFTAIRVPVILVIIIPALLPYAIWVLPAVIKGQTSLAGAAVRRAKFNSRQVSNGEAFHRCETCGRTEKTDPHLDFFTADDGREYCADHVPAKEPVTR